MSAKRSVRNQTLGGIGLVLFGLLMLWHARWALLHHTVLVPRYPSWGKSAWMNPWQAVAVAAVCFILGAVLAIDALRKRRKGDANSSTD
jgi:multisubunit Na+/H+ antiporter MnhB subunit